MGTQLPLPQSPPFSAHICCGQMAEWIKMPLGMEKGLGPGDCVRWGPSSPPKKVGGAPSPIFGLCPLWRNGWVDQDATWHTGGPWYRLHCARLGPSNPLQKGGSTLAKKGLSPFPNFRPISIVAKRLDAPGYHGTDVCLGPGYIVRWGPSSPPPKRDTVSCNFLAHVCCGWVNQDAAWYKDRSRPMPHCVRR